MEMIVGKFLKNSSYGIQTTPLLMEHILWNIISNPFYGVMDCSHLFSFLNWGGSTNLGFLKSL